jgi:hypothetical protein
MTYMMKHKILYKKIFPFLLFTSQYLGGLGLVKAQSGQYLQLWGGPQYVALLNYQGYETDTLYKIRSSLNTYKWGGGIDYINNFSQNYGFQTGIYYSRQGQNYFGTVHDFYDTAGKNLGYTSSISMDYIRVPLMFRFNSIIDEGDRVNLSIFMGLQLGYLLQVSSITDPPPPAAYLNRYPNFDFKQLYNAWDFGLAAGAQFNIKLKENLYGVAGIRFDRSIGGIENTSYVLPDDAPVEWMYPVSTRKESRPDHRTILAYTQSQPSKLISVNVYLGLAFKVKKGKPEKPHPVDDIQQ